jgi:hypothetical protein
VFFILGKDLSVPIVEEVGCNPRLGRVVVAKKKIIAPVGIQTVIWSTTWYHVFSADVYCWYVSAY